jgi:hypothetical protein
VDALEALIIAAQAGSLARRSKKAAAAPLIEVAALTPGTSGDIRIAGLPKGVTVAVNYAPSGPLDKASKREREDDLKQYRRVSAKTILSAAEALIAHEEDR